MPPTVVIVGPPACGKTTIGSALADELRLHFSDTDADVEAEAQMTIADIFLLRGEAEFRRLEEQASTDALERDGGVLALGSGTIESPRIRGLLKDQFVVQLRLGAAEAAKRAGITGARPVQLGNLRSKWNKSMAHREPMYAQTADLVIDTGSAGVEACVTEIAAEILNRSRPSQQTPGGLGQNKSGGGSSD